MTPQEARRLLDGTTPGPWFFDDDMAGTVHTIGPIVPCGNELDCSTDDAALAAHAPDMAAMIAGMREEWGVHVTGYPTNIADWAEICDGPADSIEWFADEEAAEDFATEREDDGYDARLVRRYVTTPEEA